MQAAWRPPVLGLAGIATAVSLWQVVASLNTGFGANIPSVPDTARTLFQLAGTASFWATTGATLGLWAIGMAVVVVVALPLGVVIGSSPTVRTYTASTVDFLRSIPHVALLPVALVMLGSKSSMVIVMILIGAVWPLLVQTISGIDSVDPVTKDTSRVLRLSRWEAFRHILVPGAMPYIATGLRLSASLALIVTVVAGMLAGTPGIGQSIVRAEEGFQLAELYVYVLTVGALGLLVNAAFQALERRLLHWQQLGGTP